MVLVWNGIKTEEEAKAAMDKLKGKDNKDIERDIERD